MVLLAALVVGLVVGILSGGKLGNVGNLNFRWPWFVVAALVVREASILTPLARIVGQATSGLAPKSQRGQFRHSFAAHG